MFKNLPSIEAIQARKNSSRISRSVCGTESFFSSSSSRLLPRGLPLSFARQSHENGPQDIRIRHRSSLSIIRQKSLGQSIYSMCKTSDRKIVAARPSCQMHSGFCLYTEVLKPKMSLTRKSVNVGYDQPVAFIYFVFNLLILPHVSWTTKSKLLLIIIT